MRGEETADERGTRRPEEQVRQGFRPRMIDARAESFGGVEAADLAQRAADAVGVARELDCAGVGEELALARNGGLDQPSEEHADVTEHPQGDAGQGDHRDAAAAVAAAAAAAGDLEQEAASHRDHREPEQHPDEPHVQPHVAVQHVRELVPDHALQLVARQPREGAARHGDHGIVDRVPRGERVDRVLVIHDEHARHRDAGRDRHLLDDVEQAAIEQVARRRIDRPRTDHLRDRVAAGRERAHLDCRAAGYQAEHDQRVGQEEPVRKGRRRPGAAGRQEGREVDPGADHVHRDDDADDSEREKHDQPPARAARDLLMLEEVHGMLLSGRAGAPRARRPSYLRQNCTFTGRRSSSLSVDSSSSAGPNENALAMTFVGNCWAEVL